MPAHPLSILEVLRNIFECLDDSDNLPAALVCTTWSSVALPLIWKDVSFNRILALFPPRAISETENGTRVETFTRNIQAEDWARFDKYSNMIRALHTHKESESEDIDPPHPSFLMDIACSRPRAVLIPNLKRLEVNDDTSIIHLFAHQDVKDFRVQYCRTPTDTMLRLIASKMPHLETVSLGIPGLPDPRSEEAIVAMMSELPSLKSVYLPLAWFTTKIINELAAAPQLQILQFSPFISTFGLAEASPNAFPPNSFPCLRSLQMAVSFERAISCFSLPHRPQNIDTLFIMSLGTEPITQLRRLIDQIASVYPHIEDLTIFSVASQTDDDLDEWFSILQRIRGLASLQRLHLAHDTFNRLNLFDIISIGQALPSLRLLRLSPSGKSTSAPHLDITTLLICIPHFPNLTELWLHVDAPASNLPCVEPGARFPKLELLGLLVKRSRVNNPEGVAAFVANILPKGCEVVFEQSPPARWLTVISLMKAKGIRVLT